MRSHRWRLLLECWPSGVYVLPWICTSSFLLTSRDDSAMNEPSGTTARPAPTFVLVDDDRNALELIQRKLDPEWYYVPIWETPLVVWYASHFATTAIFLAEPIDHPNGGAVRLLQDLRDTVGKPVVILSEVWSPEIAARWKELGASDCIPHPTRFHVRMEALRSRMQDFANEAPSAAPA